MIKKVYFHISFFLILLVAYFSPTKIELFSIFNSFEKNEPCQPECCVKGVHIRSYSGQHFPAFGLNTER